MVCGLSPWQPQGLSLLGAAQPVQELPVQLPEAPSQDFATDWLPDTQEQGQLSAGDTLTFSIRPGFKGLCLLFNPHSSARPNLTCSERTGPRNTSYRGKCQVALPPPSQSDTT